MQVGVRADGRAWSSSLLITSVLSAKQDTRMPIASGGERGLLVV